MLSQISNYVFSVAGGVVCFSAFIHQLYCNWRSYTLSLRRNSISLSSEKVVIIGASSGIGRELALQYAQRGASIILVARREELLKELAQDCIDIANNHALEIQVQIFSCDITCYEKLSGLANFIESKFQMVDTLILNAGAISVLTFSDLVSDAAAESLPLLERLGSVQDIMSINYVSFVHITAHLLKLLEKSIAGNIVVVSSAAGVVGTPTRSLYAASKHALHGFYNSLRMELEATKSNIHVTIVCPGSVDTKLRLSSVDGSKLKSSQADIAGVTSGKLSPQLVAERIIVASDDSEDLVFIPSAYRHSVWLAHFFPSIIFRLARKKYGL